MRSIPECGEPLVEMRDFPLPFLQNVEGGKRDFARGGRGIPHGLSSGAEMDCITELATQKMSNSHQTQKIDRNVTKRTES